MEAVAGMMARDDNLGLSDSECLVLICLDWLESQ